MFSECQLWWHLFTSVSMDSFRKCAWILHFHFTRCKRLIVPFSDIEDKIWGQYKDNNRLYQLPPSVTPRTISLTIWFARSKLLVFSPTSFSLLTFTFLEFLSKAFFACASFTFLSCQARCLCRTLAIDHTFITNDISVILQICLESRLTKPNCTKIVEKKHNSLIQSLLGPWLNRTVGTGEGRLRPAEWRKSVFTASVAAVSSMTYLPVTACHVSLQGTYWSTGKTTEVARHRRGSSFSVHCLKVLFHGSLLVYECKYWLCSFGMGTPGCWSCSCSGHIGTFSLPPHLPPQASPSSSSLTSLLQLLHLQISSFWHTSSSTSPLGPQPLPSSNNCSSPSRWH